MGAVSRKIKERQGRMAGHDLPFHGARREGDDGTRQLAALPVMRSLLSPEAVAMDIAPAYGLSPTGCVLQRSFTNDVYVVKTSAGLYVAKVYGPGWRTAADIAYEVDFLNHLTANGVAVATAVPRRDGQPVHSLPLPEGVRYCVLFTYAPGEEPAEPFTAALYHLFGRAAGALHQAADRFVSRHPRFRLDLAYLIDRPLAAIRPYLVHRPDDWAYLMRLAERVRARIGELAARGLDWGPCHGDLTLDCFRLTGQGQLTFYDFDSGGPGWRALEFQGMYAYAPHPHWEAFHAGYAEIRPLDAVDLAAIPWFVPAYAIWDMGWAASTWARWSGRWRVDDAYWSEKRRWLSQWEAERLGPG